MNIQRIPMVRPRFAQAFTLIELLVVISIIALLAALSMGTFSMATQAASRNRTYGTLQAIASALERYKEANGEYPVLPNMGSATNPTTSSHDFTTTDGAEMLYQAITGDGNNRIAVGGGSGSNPPTGSVLPANAQYTINGDFIPSSSSNGSTGTTWKSKLNATMVDASNKFYLIDGFGHPFQYDRGLIPNINSTSPQTPITVNPAFDLWSYSTATGSSDPKGSLTDKTSTSSDTAGKLAIWIKNW